MSSSHSTTSYSSYSYSSSSSTNGQHMTGTRAQQTTHTDSSGRTTVHTATQNLGQPVVQDTRSYDAEGRELIGDAGAARIGGSGSAPRIEDVTDQQRANDKLYEERMEDEYAKREGGA